MSAQNGRRSRTKVNVVAAKSAGLLSAIIKITIEVNTSINSVYSLLGKLGKPGSTQMNGLRKMRV